MEKTGMKVPLIRPASKGETRDASESHHDFGFP